MKVVLLCPEIPQNTGNIIRLCACANIELILVGPLGFSMDNKLLKRTGLDYHDMAKVKLVENKIIFLKSIILRNMIITSYLRMVKNIIPI